MAIHTVVLTSGTSWPVDATFKREDGWHTFAGTTNPETITLINRILKETK